jgi:hypothetical protein
MGKTSPQAVVLDTGALIAFERGDAKMRALVREAVRTRARLVIPREPLARHGAGRHVKCRSGRS